MSGTRRKTVFGWAMWHGHPTANEGSHRHDELEVVFVERGPCDMEVAGATLAMNTGALAAFWAMGPHQITQTQTDTLLYRLTVPVHDYLQWHLPAVFTRRLLGGKVVAEQDTAMAPMDRALFKKWHSDLSGTAIDARRILHLEVEARLLRLLRSAHLQEENASGASRGALGSEEVDHAILMVRYIAEHYTEPVHGADVAREVHLSEQYAMRLFTKTFGMSMHNYLNRYRISHACSLLATTNRKVIDVAMEAGFGSMSRFYESFTKACGQSPHEYRAGGGERLAARTFPPGRAAQKSSGRASIAARPAEEKPCAESVPARRRSRSATSGGAS